MGSSPACARTRIASAPAPNDGQRHPSYVVTSGARRTRSVTEVMTPNAPSEPRTSWRRSGPAALAGAEPRSSEPVGVATVSPTTIASKRP